MLTSTCRYADVSHEHRPFTSGHRIVLECNFYQPPKALVESTAGLYADKKKLRNILVLWTRNIATGRSNCAKMLAQVRSYKYTDANVIINILEGDDWLRPDCCNLIAI